MKPRGLLRVSAVHKYIRCRPLPQMTLHITNRAGLVTLVKKTVKVQCSGRVDDLSRPPDDGYPSIEEVSIRISLLSDGNTFGSAGDQMYVFQTAGAQTTSLDASQASNPKSKIFETIGTAFVSASVVPGSTTLLFRSRSLDTIQYVRLTCRAFENYIYHRVRAKIVGVSVSLLSGVEVEVGVENVTHSGDQGVICGRRGNLFEDDQDFYAVRLGSIGNGKAILGGTGKGTVRDQTKDGFYAEVLPGSYRYGSTLAKLNSGIKDTTCGDDENLKFVAFQPAGEKVGCKYVSKGDSETRTWYCETLTGVEVECPLTCGKCKPRNKKCRDSAKKRVTTKFLKVSEATCKWLSEQSKQTRTLNCKSNREISNGCKRVCGGCGA